MRRTVLSSSRPVVLTLLIAGAFAVTGCTASPSASPTPSASTGAATSSPTPTASAAVFVPDGSAADNLPLFTQVMDTVAATEASVQGRAYIDALVAAGFPKDAMEVTRDLTTVGNAAESIQFSVQWAGECLVGQVGPSVPTPTALVLPLVPGDTCLIGQTRPIDW